MTPPGPPALPRVRPITAATLLLLIACNDAATVVRQPLALVAAEDDGGAVEGVRFWADGVELGATDADGALQVELSGHAGQRVALSAACPAGYAPGTERRALTLRAVEPVATPRALQLRVTCERLEQLAALVVRATGTVPASIPIRVRDEVVGQTDADGVAHVLLEARPGATLRVRLDTSSAPHLVPASPTRTFQIGSEAEVLLFDQAFEHERRRARRERARPITPAQRPYRLH